VKGVVARFPLRGLGLLTWARVYWAFLSGLGTPIGPTLVKLLGFRPRELYVGFGSLGLGFSRLCFVNKHY
jgi:hypothetical protein